MIARQWRGLARSTQAPNYVQHLHGETFPALRRIPGFVDATILTRLVEGGVEFVVLTRWQSLDAVRTFAGADPEAAVVPAEVAAMMVAYDERATHFEVVE
jgi:heme-degrading monooxygenase HmoA